MGVEFTFAFGDVRVDRAVPYSGDGSAPAFSSWPCPGCGSRQLLDDAWLLDVRDIGSNGASRPVLVCAGCAVRANVMRLRSEADV